MLLQVALGGWHILTPKKWSYLRVSCAFRSVSRVMEVSKLFHVRDIQILGTIYLLLAKTGIFQKPWCLHGKFQQKKNTKIGPYIHSITMNVHNMLFGGKHKLQNRIFHIIHTHVLPHDVHMGTNTQQTFSVRSGISRGIRLATSIVMSEIWKGKGEELKGTVTLFHRLYTYKFTH